MKKVLFSMLVLASAFTASANTAPAPEDPAPNEEARAAFTRSVTNATEVKWFKNENGSQVSFMQGAVRTKLLYDESGEVRSSLRYYSGDELPMAIRASIAKRHADKTIFGVTEVIDADGTSYHVVLEGEKTWTLVKSDALGQLSATRKYSKA